MRTLIVGHGGRESSLAWRIAQASTLFAVIGHENPTILHYVNKTGGKYKVANVCDPEAVSSFAAEQKIDLALVSADSPLAAGVVDALLERGIKTVGPTKSGAEIEWNKAFSREIVEAVAPESNPFYRIAHSTQDVENIFDEIGTRPVAIKPSGLTSGKGVKVMGPHLADTAAAKAYAIEILETGIGGGGEVIIEERLTGAEFTIQAITDGKTVVMPPATYDYPYRYIDDTGPGTGGMGAYSAQHKNLPFMTYAHYQEAERIIRAVVAKLDELGRHFNGVLNAGFFVTDAGEIKVIEFNARFGDPECMNIMLLLNSSWLNVMERISDKKLTEKDIEFSKKSSLVIYLVSPDYALDKPDKSYPFNLDVKAIESTGCKVFFASSRAASIEGSYETVGTSRCVAIGCTAETLDDAHQKIKYAIDHHVVGPLEWRADIGTLRNINFIRRKINSLHS